MKRARKISGWANVAIGLAVVLVGFAVAVNEPHAPGKVFLCWYWGTLIFTCGIVILQDKL